MKLCFVILAHHNPGVFRRLCSVLSANHPDIVVHLDSRANMADFSAPPQENIHYTPKRNRVNWSGWSLTQTILATLDHALAISDARYFLLLAGTDFPIRPLDSLTEYLCSQYPANFLSYYPLVPGIWGYQLISRYHFNDLKGALTDIRSPVSSGLPASQRMFGWMLNKFEGGLYALLPPRNTTWTRFYSGSARWCLNRDTVRYLVEYYRSPGSSRLRSFLSRCANSDEIFVQSVVLNSAFRDQCVGFSEAEAREIFEGERPPLPDEKKLNLHYVDWSPEREDPAILVESDFHRLKESGKFFAYKFSDERSLPLVERIERELLGMG